MPSLIIAQVAVATPDNPTNTYNPTIEARFDQTEKFRILKETKHTILQNS
jgi:hypothetical protein